MDDPNGSFDPLDFGFRRFDLTYASLEFFERDLGSGGDEKPDPARINVYLTKDGDFVTVWSGLFDIAITEGIFEAKSVEGFDLFRQYNEDLFRGHITTCEEAAVILKALRLERYLPAKLRVDEAGCLLCENLKQAS